MEKQINIIAEAKFLCIECNKVAGIVQLNSDNEVFRKSFTGELKFRIDEDKMISLKENILKSNSGELYNIDKELASFYCPNCDACYCGDHWNHWEVYEDESPGWYDCVIGKCPKGHEKMIED